MIPATAKAIITKSMVSSFPGSGCADFQRHPRLALHGPSLLAGLGEQERESLDDRIRVRHQMRIGRPRGSSLQALPQVFLDAPRALDMQFQVDGVSLGHDSMMASESFTDKRSGENTAVPKSAL
jgi:hypothetical protein